MARGRYYLPGTTLVLWRLEFGVGIFHEFFASKCWWSGLLQDDLSTGRLAGELLQDDLSTGQSNRGILMGIMQSWSRAFYDGKEA